MKIFSCVWLHFKKCFEKYFLVFGCILENTIENTFSTCCSHFLTFSRLPKKYIISFIPQYRNTNKTQKKNIIKSGQIERRRKREREATGFDKRWDRATWCCDRDWREGKIAIGTVLQRSDPVKREREIEKERDRRRDLIVASVSRSFSLSFSLCAFVSSFLCASQFRKWFEGKIKMEMILQDQKAYFTVNGNYFLFDLIF